MYAQLSFWDGPRSAELVAAHERAGRERIMPAIEADETMQQELVAVLVLRGRDGGEVVVSVTRTECGLERAREVIFATELLPGEDPALLQDPDRIEIFEVVDSRLPIGARS
jgi:hypothetical protein